MEKRRPKHPKIYKLQDYKKMSRKDYILARKVGRFAEKIMLLIQGFGLVCTKISMKA
jgi:hypothetical protein